VLHRNGLTRHTGNAVGNVCRRIVGDSDDGQGRVGNGLYLVVQERGALRRDDEPRIWYVSIPMVEQMTLFISKTIPALARRSLTAERLGRREKAKRAFLMMLT
jgi:hypothetical protein